MRTTGIVVFALLCILSVVGLLLPTQFNISRSIDINADQQVIHRYVSELKNWDLWTPWKELDPSVVVTLGEKTTGIGASQTWTGKDGDGSLMVTMSSPETGIKYDLLLGDDAENCESAVTYSPINQKTRVTWTMKGDMTMPIVGGYVAVLMDTMAGEMFDRGLLNLKRIAEQSSEKG